MDIEQAIAAALAAPGADAAARAQAVARQAALTKPAGALGRLEALAVWYAGWRPPPAPWRPLDAQALVFAADHGVAARGVSPYPAAVTGQMLANFQAGGAAINQLCAAAGARLSAVDVGVGPERATNDLAAGPAMSRDGFAAAFAAGWEAVDPQAEALILGEMGIGATTAASAVAALLLGGAPEGWVGAGAGADAAAQARKRAAVAGAVARHGAAAAAPLEALRRAGGKEMAAIAGALTRARAARLPTLLDGFIVSAAALALRARDGDLLSVAAPAHRSAEAAHGRVLDALALGPPLLDLGLRLGEGSGAALALPLLNAALACHVGMATFEDAAVSRAGADG